MDVLKLALHQDVERLRLVLLRVKEIHQRADVSIAVFKSLNVPLGKLISKVIAHSFDNQVASGLFHGPKARLHWIVHLV